VLAFAWYRLVPSFRFRFGNRHGDGLFVNTLFFLLDWFVICSMIDSWENKKGEQRLLFLGIHDYARKR